MQPHLHWTLRFFIEPPLRRPPEILVPFLCLIVLGSGPLLMWIVSHFWRAHTQPCHSLSDFRNRFLARTMLPLLAVFILILAGLSVRLLI